MSLSSLQLAAFAEVARCGSFSAAAKTLHVTQSALSQRVLNLEAELETALFVREPKQLRLTPSGQQLLRYCQNKERMEAEVLKKISTGQAAGGGVVRIGSFSSVVRSALLPKLNELAQSDPDLRFELFNREIAELPAMLSRNEVDYILTISETSRHDLDSRHLGFEENVLCESSRIPCRDSVYLDHDADDSTSADFIRLNPTLPPMESQHFLDEIYAILDGVRLGWGRAVVPKHLIVSDPDIKIVKGLESLQVPIFLQYFRQSFYPNLHGKIIDALTSGPLIGASS